MKPEEKAKELIDRMGKIIHGHFPPNNTSAKSCALICVEEILLNNFWEDSKSQDNYRIYWQQVKSSIEQQ